MKTLLPAFLACALLCACGSQESSPLSPLPGPTDPPPVYIPQLHILYGTVRDAEGVPIPGSRVEITVGDPSFLGRFSVTDERGDFRLEGLAGPLRIRVTRPGHEPVVQDVLIVADVRLDVRLTRLDLLPLGNTVRSITNQAPCDPIRWDARAPCRRFYFEAPGAGLLVLTVRFASESFDATMTTAGTDEYLAVSKEGAGSIELSERVEAGGKYEIRVNSYYSQQEFELRADLVRDGP